VVEEPLHLLAFGSDDEEEAPPRVVLHRWEDWDVEDHPDKAAHLAASRAFDDLYHRTRDLLSSRWGKAVASGRHRLERQRH